jgi:anti-sigma factor ChrR (cupin superfamily)
MTTSTYVPQTRDVKIYHRLLDGGLDAAQFDWTGYARGGAEGISVEWLYTAAETADGAEACIARYAAGACSDAHEHLGYELTLVLDGELRDDHGESYPAGTLVVEHPGSVHRLSSPTGATALVVREKGLIVDAAAADGPRC